MRGREWESYAATHLEALLPPDFKTRRALTYRQTTDGLIHGILCDPSGFSADAFYLHVFVHPLYMPRPDGITLSYGTRSAWDRSQLDGELARRVADTVGELIHQNGDARQLARRAGRMIRPHGWRHRHMIDVNHCETAGRSWMRSGHPRKATRILRLAAQTDDDRDWAQVVAQRCANLALLIERDPSEAMGNLEDAIANSRAALKLL